LKFYNIHTHSFTNNNNQLEIVNQYPWEFNNEIPVYSIGIHPWYINENRVEVDLNIMETTLNEKKCVAVGECGLDKRIDISIDFQIEVFKKQIVLAEQYNKPIILHLVGAFDELIQLKRKLKIKVPMIIHGFSKSNQLAQQLVNEGFYLSFGKYLLRNPELSTVFKSIPNDKFFLETDTIEETIIDVYLKASKIKGMEIDELKKQIENNAKIFNF
jgi:TatD DNase family protein